MLFTLCQSCHAAYEVVGSELELKNLFDVPEWRGSFPCVRGGCAGRALRCNFDQASELPARTKVPAQVYFRSLYGMCEPTGVAPTFEDVQSAFRRSVAEVVGYATGEPPRVVVDKIILDDGTRLHFAPSTLGAVIYFIEAPPRSGLEVIGERDRDAAQGDPRSCAEDRSEGRPADRGAEEAGQLHPDTSQLQAPDVLHVQPEGRVPPGPSG